MSSSSSSSSLCRRKRSRVFLFFTKKTSFRLNEEKNFSLINNKLIYIHFYSHLSFFLLGDLSAPLLRETVSKRERDMPKTRAQKRRIGERDVWSLIVNNDDICFKHILPRLNSNDVKFLYDVNTETRKLIKRSSRKGELKKKFRVREMSSVSTLEVAWEHIPWGTYNSVEEEMDEPYFCWQVARTNKLELLKWIREEKKCEWDEGTNNEAACHGNLEMVKYCVANECPVDTSACAYAALKGHLEMLKYLHEEVKAPWDSGTASFAAENGHLHILEYLVERKFDEYDGDGLFCACKLAAENGHLDCLKYLHETAKAPWNSDAIRGAHANNQTECVQYLLDNNCPLPPGWRYEHGEILPRIHGQE